MDVRQYAVQTPKKGRTQQQARHNGQESQVFQMEGKFQSGLQHAEKGCGQHHAPAPPSRQSMVRRKNSRRVKMSAAPKLTES